MNLFGYRGLLTEWEGFNKLGPTSSSDDPFIHPFPLFFKGSSPSKSNADKSIAAHVFSVLQYARSFAEYGERGIKDAGPFFKNIDEKAHEIGLGFSLFPFNRHSGLPVWEDVNPSGGFISSHLRIIQSISSDIGVEDYYVLALMLANEALRLKTDDRFVAALDAVEVASFASLWFTDAINKNELVPKLEAQFSLEKMKDALEEKKENFDKKNKPVMERAEELRKENPEWKLGQIAKKLIQEDDEKASKKATALGNPMHRYRTLPLQRAVKTRLEKHFGKE